MVCLFFSNSTKCGDGSGGDGDGNWTMAGVWVPYWACISEAGFDAPAVLFLADLTLSKLQSLWLAAWHGLPTLFPIVKEELFS